MSETLRRIAVAVVVHQGRVLVGRRSLEATEAAGLDEFPGGTVEPHETVAEAAARECLEETGLAVQVGSRSVGVAASRQHPQIMVSFVWATPIDPTAIPTPPFAWIPISRLPECNFPVANAAVLTQLRLDHGGS